MKKRVTAICLILMLAFTGCTSKKTSDIEVNSKETSTDTNSDTSSETSNDTTEEQLTTEEQSISDTILWFNGIYGIITTRNGGDISLFGGYDMNEAGLSDMVKQGLKESWDVTDRKSADETLQWLLEEGHNAEVVETYKENGLTDFTREELVTELSDSSYKEEERVYYLGLFDAVEAYGDNAILAWDLSRAMQLSSWYYLAGYYTYEEALDSCLEIATRLQSTYTSWDEMIQSYFYGFQYWNEDDMNDPSSESYARIEIYNNLKEEANSPYSLDWNLELKKDW